MSANKDRSYSRVVHFETLIELAREKDEPTSYLEEQRLSALVIAELNSYL